MNNFPSFGFPSIPYYNYRNRYNNIHKASFSNPTLINPTLDDTPKKENENEKRKSSKSNNFNPIHINFDSFSDSEQEVIEILGIKLYLDDIIILCLLFLLYLEETKDEGLFICLILLLLT